MCVRSLSARQNKGAINTAGAIPKLVRLLQPDSLTAAAATEALGALAVSNNKNKNDIRVAGGVTALVSLERHAQGAAAKAGTAASVGPSAVSRTSAGNDAPPPRSAWALRNLAAGNGLNRSAYVTAV